MIGYIFFAVLGMQIRVQLHSSRMHFSSSQQQFAVSQQTQMGAHQDQIKQRKIGKKLLRIVVDDCTVK